ncbi:MAG: hypothetical protein H6666_12085 [Ardenticatenaceae bacterium]|nr:hypothetical protein [Anaerolineales bacterium]MCB8918649.1 hypothetical protein [Ardenticatenaceae bacterium]
MVKRIGLLVISFLLGAALTTAIVMFPLGTTVAEFGAFYFFMTSLAFGIAIALVLDKFAGTELLPK